MARPSPLLRVLPDPRADGSVSPPNGQATPAPAPDRRVVLLSAELDLLELTPFYSADSAFAPSVALERRARPVRAEHLQKRAQLNPAHVLGRKGKATASREPNRGPTAW